MIFRLVFLIGALVFSYPLTAQSNPTPVTQTESSSFFLVPKKVHFVWMGKRIPQKYIDNIRSFIIRNPDYEFNLWLDRPMNYELSLALLDAGQLPLRTRSFQETLPHLPPLLQSYFERERNGVFPNFAAASDIIRIQILIDEGGVYFDTDVFMEEKFNDSISSLGNIYAPFGFLFNVETKNQTPEPPKGKNSATGLPKISGWNNNVLAAVKDSYFLNQIQQKMIFLHKYKEDEGRGHSRNSKGKVTRWSYGLWITKRYNPGTHTRFSLTLELTGPEVLRSAVEESAYAYLEALTPETLERLTSEFPSLILKPSNSLKRFTAINVIHDQYRFIQPEHLIILGFKFDIPGFHDHCDNSWVQRGEAPKGTRSAEWL